MRKTAILLLTAACIFTIIGCGNDERSSSQESSTFHEEQESHKSENELAEAGLSVSEKEEQKNGKEPAEASSSVLAEDDQAEKQEDTKTDDSASSELTNGKEKPVEALTEEQIEEAKQAALAYYEGTVFIVNTIEYFEGELSHRDVDSDCNFIVNVSKGGVIQEPDRTISLKLKEDGWKVVNEGY